MVESVRPSADTIRRILTDYIAAESVTGGFAENSATEFLRGVFSSAPYFSENNGSWGCYDIPEDFCGRSVFWAVIRGEGPQTVVLIHHSDVAGVEDFGSLKDIAFSPDALRDALLKIRGSLSPDARADLESGAFLFGHGGADMKGGGAVQIALMLRFGELIKREDVKFRGNVIMLALPDEENLSAGMCAATGLLASLKKRHGFDYRLTINSEPHQRRDFSRGVFSAGSVGKAMPFYYARGSLAHISKVFEGVNPIGILSALVRATELNLAFSDVSGGEAAPPPTWSYFRDRKDAYDVSMPLSAAGCFSILTLGRDMNRIARELRETAEVAAGEVYRRANESYRRYLALTAGNAGTAEAEDDRPADFPYTITVSSFDELLREAEKDGGEEFRRAWTQRQAAANDNFTRPASEDSRTAAELTFELIDFVFDRIRDLRPRIVFGLLPPWYPAVSNIFLDKAEADSKALTRKLAAFSADRFGVPYDTENFYTGISDLSYAGYGIDARAEQALTALMPLYGGRYTIPFGDIAEIAMPVINIGPWGKDFHKLTERVLIDDVCRHTPEIILAALSECGIW
ncbi:MAG: M20/M25/M40 family metallo-hydrolase [Clostridiales Family XIII bacterium]|jgi:arginine utilization protein RocB|nr:M20/M25/M40 family metallo-hydrolase [Clostridiales Family XIII bacterium]